MENTKKIKILFLCTGNSCRSQMAEGWARTLKSDQMEVYSAGVAPSTIDPRAVKVMAESGVDISGQNSKNINEFMGVQFDYVVTLCDHANESCPVFPGKSKRVHKGFDDPPVLAAGALDEDTAMSHYRRVRDEIRSFVEGLPENLEKQTVQNRNI
jgi:arsenate reductase (thioredoxin)